MIEAIESALSQTYPHIEIIVVDDGSDDGTEQALAPYHDQIRYIFQNNKGEGAARNTAIRASRGEYIALLDSDDLWIADKLEHQVAYLARHPHVALVASHASRITDPDDFLSIQLLHPSQPDGLVSIEQIIVDSPLTASTLMVRRKCLPSLECPFTPGVRFGADWEFCLRIAAQWPVGYLAAVLTRIRMHSGNVTTSLASRESVQERLDNRLAILLRIRSLLTSSDTTLRAFRASEALEYAVAAVAGYANRDYLEATGRLRKAVSLDPDMWTGTHLVDLVSHYGGMILRTNGESAAISFLDNTLGHLAPELPLPPRFQREIWARVYMASAFESYRQLDSTRVLRSIVKAIRYQPTAIINRGAMAILGRSLVRIIRHSMSE